jgi:hypothetical protein
VLLFKANGIMGGFPAMCNCGRLCQLEAGEAQMPLVGPKMPVDDPTYVEVIVVKMK